MKPLTAASHLGWVAERPPGKRQLVHSMIVFPIGGNPIWNWSRRKFSKLALCIATTACR